MTAELALKPAELATVRAVLAAHLPADVRVAAFGSRVRGKPKPWSDLDLELAGSGPISLPVLAELAEAFDECPLPWKVDLVDRATVTPEFGAIIDAEKVEIDLRA